MEDIKCYICHKPLVTRDNLTATDLDDLSKMVYHESFGVACLSHNGVREIYEELVKDATTKLKREKDEE